MNRDLAEFGAVMLITSFIGAALAGFVLWYLGILT
jgi:hypothetical protein